MRRQHRLPSLAVGALTLIVWPASCSLVNAPDEPADPASSEGGQGAQGAQGGQGGQGGVHGPDTCAEITCDSHATCDDSSGQAICSCDAGYAGDGETCADEDECDLGSHDCDVNASCTNTEGSYECACNAGFTGDGFDCLDEDECALGTHDCDVNASCTNTDGGFDCTCNPGYAGDGQICADEDECTLGTHDCDVNASCTNTDGGFDCACNPGSFGDGHLCYRVLLVDDDEALTAEVGWLTVMDSALGLVPDLETLANDANPSSNLPDYDVVVWIIGDRWSGDLTAANVATLIAYLDGGGRLLYAGGHCVYDEQPAAAQLMPTYLGLSNVQNNMPTFANNALSVYADGTGHTVTGSDMYTFQVWSGGSTTNMFSAFSPNLPTTEPMLKHRSDNLNLSGSTDFSNEYVAAVNVTNVFRAMTWGFDIGHVDPAQRDQLLADALDYLVQ